MLCFRINYPPQEYAMFGTDLSLNPNTNLRVSTRKPAFSRRLVLSGTVLVSGCLFAPSAVAYLDPGTGSIILQSILASIAVAVASISMYWERFKLFFATRFSRRKPTLSEDAKDTDD